MVGVLARLGVLDEVLDLGCSAAHAGVQLQRRGDRSRRKGRHRIRAPSATASRSAGSRSTSSWSSAHAGAESVDFVERANVTGVLLDEERVAGRGARRRAHAPARTWSSAPRSPLARRQAGGARDGARVAAVPRAVLPVRLGPPGPDGGAPDAAEFSQLEDELAYVFPSDPGTTCVAVSVNLASFRRLRRDVGTRFRGGGSRHRGLAARVAAGGTGGASRRADRSAASCACRGVRAGRSSAMPRCIRIHGPASDRHGRGPRDLPGRGDRRLAAGAGRGAERRSRATTSAATPMALELFHYTVGFARDLRTLPD